jgi:dihydroorotate dehydrogenase electron transfer subunit
VTAAQVVAEVVSRTPVGAYHLFTITAERIAAAAQPGQFVAVAVGGEGSPMLLRRAFAIYGASSEGTVQFVVSARGAGTRWLTRVEAGDRLDVVGPLGQPFELPTQPTPAVLVGGGYGSAPLAPLAIQLRSRGCRAATVIGASTADRLFAATELERLSDTLTITTDDGSVGQQGFVSDVLPKVIQQAGAGVVYACGPMGMLRACGDIAASFGIGCQVAVEESMACGIGVCMTCVLPVIGADGVTRMVRSCVEGPVFSADRVRWDDIGTIPSDALGASAMSPSAEVAS